VRRIAALEATQCPGCVSLLGVESAYDRIQIARRDDLLILEVT
jgi:hypothetical protein